MASLNDFQTGSDASLEDFKQDANKVAPVSNDASNRNLAAHAVMVSNDPESIKQNYQAINAEMSLEGKSALAENLVNQIKDHHFTQARQSLLTVLADPNVSDEQKRKAASSVYDANSSLYSIRNIVSTEAVSQPMKDEPHEVDLQRTDVVGPAINQMNQIKAAQQMMLNREMAKNDPTLWQDINDFAQLNAPFARQIMTARSLSSADDENKVKDFALSFIAAGSEKAKLRDFLKGIRPEDRLTATQKIFDIINHSSNIVMGDSNDYARLDYLRTVAEDGYYTNEDKWFDNVTGLLDLTVLGGPLAKFAKGVKEGREAAGWQKAEKAFVDSYAAGQAKKDYVRSTVQPLSLSQTVKDVNPEKYRGLHEIAMSDSTDEASKAVYGTTKDEAAGHDLGPEIGREDGSVKAKVASPDAINNQALTPAPEVADFVNSNGAIYYTQAEKASARANVVNDFQHAFDLTDRKEMFQVLSFDKADKSSGVKIKAVYGPQSGGYSNPLDAIELAKWGLRKHGIDDKNITLLKRVGSDYVPVDPNDLKPKGDPGFYNGSDADAAYRSGHYAETNVKGGKVRVVGVDHGGDVKEVVAFDENGKQIGNVLYGTSDIRVDNPNVKVDPEWQRKGVANALYDYAEKHGAKFPTADTQKNYRSEAGQSFRDARANRQKKLEFTGASGGGSGDYLVQVDYDYDFNPGDVSEWSKLDVKRNPFDRMAPLTQGRAGSLNRHFFDIASMLDPTIVKGAFAQTDKAAGLEKRLLDVGDKFAKGFLAAKPEMQQKMIKAITEANAKSMDFDYIRMAADGFLPQDMDVLRSWRDYWDTHWYLENRDLAKSLKTKGYMQYIDPENKTHLFARPIKRGQVKGSVKAYNSSTGDIKFVKPDELDALYKNGGTVAHLRQPIHVGEDTAEFLVSTERAGGGYLRALNPDSPVLAYRKGYYHVQYKDPHFIIKNVKSESGKLLYQKAVATAPTIKQANLMVNRLKATDGGDYFHRQDKNTADYGRGDIDWDLHVTQGRSTQRIRGQRLEDATSNVADPSHSHIVDPVESMINAARSISRRASMRDFTEATKARFIATRGDFLPEGQFGQKVMPGDRKKIAYQGDKAENKKGLADARSEYEFIRYIENGYINAIDDSVKALYNNIANVLGNAGLEKGEKAMHWMSKHGAPGAFSKKIAFTAYLALNPLRQFVIQGHQAVQLLALNPKWIASGMSARETAYILARQAGIEHAPWMSKYVGSSDKELIDMYKAFEKSGLVAAIDKQNLIRENMLDAADMFNKPRWGGLSAGRKVLASPGKIARGMRKVGFDAGENLNMTTAWLAHRDLAKRAGKDLTDPAVLDQISADARNFTYGMNSAGDMPYNQNALGTYLQFMQAGHKAILTMTTNRGLSAAQRARLVAMNFVLYGVGGGTLYAYLQPYLPKNQDASDLITNGLEGTIANKALTMATGEKTRIDFSSLSPVNTYGMYDFIHSLFTTDVGAIVAGTPSGQLLFGGNSRLTKFGKDVAAYFNLRDDYDNPVTFSQVAQDFAKISSGYSNFWKAAYAQAYHKKISSSGSVVDNNVTSAEAVAQAFGFQTLDESYHYAIQDYLYGKSKDFDNDIRKWYKDYKAAVTRDGIKPEELDYVQRTYTECFRMFGNDNFRVKQVCEQMLVHDLKEGDGAIYQQALQSMNYLSPQEFKSIVNANPDIAPDEKQKLIELNDYLEQFKEKD